MNDAVISLLIQVPLVGTFVVFVIYMTRGLLHHWEQRESQEAARRKEAMDQGLTTLRLISEHHNAGLNNMREMIHEDHLEIVEGLKKISEDFARHDADEHRRWDTRSKYIGDKHGR